MAVRTMLFRGCCAVSVEPIVWVWNRSASEAASFAAYRSRMIVAQIRLAARNFATSSRSVLCAAKKKESCGAKRSTSRPLSTAESTYAIASAKVNASSCTASAPASRMW